MDFWVGTAWPELVVGMDIFLAAFDRVSDPQAGLVAPVGADAVLHNRLTARKSAQCPMDAWTASNLPPRRGNFQVTARNRCAASHAVKHCCHATQDEAQSESSAI